MTARILTAVTESDLLAYVDGRLDPRRRAEVEAHLARSPEDAGRVAADLALLAGLRTLFAGRRRPAGGRPRRRQFALAICTNRNFR